MTFLAIVVSSLVDLDRAWFSVLKGASGTVSVAGDDLGWLDGEPKVGHFFALF